MTKRILFYLATMTITLVAATAMGSLHRASPVADQPIVRDTDTGFTWQGCAAGMSGEDCETGFASSMTWQAALDYCDTLDWAGYTDWRLPSRNELQSIVDYEKYSPAIDETAFPGTPSAYFWSSSSYASNSLNAWYVYFNDGHVNGYGVKGLTVHARCVRGRVGP